MSEPLGWAMIRCAEWPRAARRNNRGGEKIMRKVTKEEIDALVAAATFTDTKLGQKTTVVCMTLPNGFELIESSGCVCAENYDHALGVDICKRRIVDKLWFVEGYRLQCDIAAGR